jgi:phosphate transport system permease protein
MKTVMYISVFLVLVFVITIIWTIFSKGLGSISWDMISKVPGPDFNTSDDGGFLNAIVGSLLVVIPATIISLIISIPVVFYITLYRKRTDKLSYIARLAYDVLYGIPSIVYGAFAFTVMVYIGMRASLMGGIVVTTFLMVPMLIRSGDEIAKTIPDEIHEATYSLGATKYETMKVIFRQALPGMATATLLAIGKAIGDAAGVMFTAGFSDAIPKSLSQPTATLPLAIFNWVTMPDPFPDRAYSAALVLTVIVLILSIGGRYISNRFSKNNL